VFLNLKATVNLVRYVMHFTSLLIHFTDVKHYLGYTDWQSTSLVRCFAYAFLLISVFATFTA